MDPKSQLPQAWNVPQVFRNRLGQGAGRQRAMFADGHLLVILHAPPLTAERARQGRFFWRDPAGKWESSNHGSGINALKKHLDEFADAIARMDSAEDKAVRSDDYYTLLQWITPMHRTARNMHAALQQARELMPEDRELLHCRDQAYAVERAADLLHTDIKNGLDCAIARRAEEQAHSSHRMELAAHRLNVLAAIFFPLVTLTAIFGMNLRHGFEPHLGPWFFWTVLLLALVIGLQLRSWIVHRPEPRAPRDAKGRGGDRERGR